jgi:RNA polymerase-binding transcription factor DksA
MKSQKDISGDISGYTLHIADVATDNYDRDFNLGLVSDERVILFEIEEALKRIEDKTYGICKLCEKPITKIRLSAIPYVKYCKKCQEKQEKEPSV